ncbi:hypothetical protein WA577_004323 [Blastocystis sp. JDR]
MPFSGLKVSYLKDDYKDYESTVKAKTNRTRKILTGNSTYLFYDQDRAAQSQDRYPYRRDSAVSHSSNNTDTAPTHKSEAELLSGEENDDYGYVSPLHQEEESDQYRPNFFSTNERQIIYRLQTLGFVKDNVYDGKIYQNSVTGFEFVSFLISRKQCEDTDQACTIGQRFVNSHILVPVDENEEGIEENVIFEGDKELYYVDDSILGVEDLGDAPQEVVQPQKEHNKILRMSGYLLTMNKDGKTQRLWYELSAGILRSYLQPNTIRQRNEESDSNCIEALDTQEFTVMPIHKGNGESTTSFKLVGTVREIQYQAESMEEYEEWMSVLRNRE